MASPGWLPSCISSQGHGRVAGASCDPRPWFSCGGSRPPVLRLPCVRGLPLTASHTFFFILPSAPPGGGPTAASRGRRDDAGGLLGADVGPAHHALAVLAGLDLHPHAAAAATPTGMPRLPSCSMPASRGLVLTAGGKPRRSRRSSPGGRPSARGVHVRPPAVPAAPR